MSLKCFFGVHQWNGCKCITCGKLRNEEHDWARDCEKCATCGNTRDESHNWSKDCEKCALCGKVRQELRRHSGATVNMADKAIGAKRKPRLMAAVSCVGNS